jgi:hypothetical protein
VPRRTRFGPEVSIDRCYWEAEQFCEAGDADTLHGEPAEELAALVVA